MIRLLSFLILAFFLNKAFALDLSEVGTYAVMGENGNTTDTLISISHASGRWSFSVMREDGSWDTCPDSPNNCAFKKPTHKELRHHFEQIFLDKYTPDCIYSDIWVFCKLASVAADKTYIIATKVPPKPRMVRLLKVSDKSKDSGGKASKSTSNSAASLSEVDSVEKNSDDEENAVINAYFTARSEIPKDAKAIPITLLQNASLIESIISSEPLNHDSPRLLQVNDQINESAEIKKNRPSVSRAGNMLNLSAGGIKYKFRDWDNRKQAEIMNVEGDVRRFKYAGVLPDLPFHQVDEYSIHDQPFPILIHQDYPLALSFSLSSDWVSIAASGERILQIANGMNPPAAVAVTSIASGQYELELSCRVDERFIPQFKGWNQSSDDDSSPAIESSDEFYLMLLSPSDPKKPTINYQAFALQFSYQDGHWNVASNDPQKLQAQTGFRCWVPPEDTESADDTDEKSSVATSGPTTEEINKTLFDDGTQLSESDLGTIFNGTEGFAGIIKEDGKWVFKDAFGGTFSLRGEIKRAAQHEQDEVWIYGGNTNTSGMTGQSIWLYLRDKNGKLQANLGFPAVIAEVTKESYRGHYDIHIGERGSCDAIWRWNGTEYEWLKNIPTTSGGCDGLP